MSYPLVTIINSTNFDASGEVDYASFFCSNDDYHVTNGATWTASSRGVCLVTKITATLNTPSGTIQATAYESSGTSYSQFAIIQISPGVFEVTRRVNALEDSVPSDYVEPTEQQK